MGLLCSNLFPYLTKIIIEEHFSPKYFLKMETVEFTIEDILPKYNFLLKNLVAPLSN